jgi:hypothetical protein
MQQRKRNNTHPVPGFPEGYLAGALRESPSVVNIDIVRDGCQRFSGGGDAGMSSSTEWNIRLISSFALRCTWRCNFLPPLTLEILGRMLTYIAHRGHHCACCCCCCCSPRLNVGKRKSADQHHGQKEARLVLLLM